MKKSIFIQTIVIICTFLLSITAKAEILPVKDVWHLDTECILVLQENGNLYYGNSIETQTPEMIASNVLDVKKYGNSYHNIAILYKNGDIGLTRHDKTTNKPFEIYKTIKANAKKIYNVGDNSSLFSVVFIDNNNFLHGILNLGHDNYNPVFLAKGVTKCSPISEDRILVLDNSTLYHLSPIYEGYGYLYQNGKPVFKKEKVLDNVKDVLLNIVLKTNGDIYYFEDYYGYLDGTITPQRIGTNISSLAALILNEYNSKIKLPLYSINEKSECLTHTKEGIKVKSENVKKAYLIGDYIYFVKKDNTLYRNSHNDNIKSEKKIASNVERMFAKVDNFIVDTDKNLYLLGGNTGREPYLSDIKDVIKKSNPYSGACEYLFIKENGELWGANCDTGETIPHSPFLTSFCKKRIRLIINSKEIQLNSKIQMVNDRTMYPFRECLENMGATVIWDDINKTAIGEYNGITIEFPIGKNKYYVNGVQHEMDTASYIDSAIGRTYIPLRYAAEGLGFTVNWIEGTSENTITIKK